MRGISANVADDTVPIPSIAKGSPRRPKKIIRMAERFYAFALALADKE